VLLVSAFVNAKDTNGAACLEFNIDPNEIAGPTFISNQLHLYTHEDQDSFPAQRVFAGTSETALTSG
jgi:hypothetical protein